MILGLYQPNLKFVSLPVPDTIKILGVVSPNLGEEEAVG